MPLFEVQFAFTVEAATPTTAEELIDEVCHFDHEEPAWLQISSIIANVYELIPKKEPTIESQQLRTVSDTRPSRADEPQGEIRNKQGERKNE